MEYRSPNLAAACGASGNNASMSLKADKLVELRVKHLEMVQSVVARMASQGAATKTACVTIVTAVVGFGVTLQKPSVVLLALLPVTIFALLDARYLQLERHFRHRFDEIRGQKWSVMPNFEIGTADVTQGYWQALRSWSIVYFYAPIALAVTVGGIFAGYLYGKFI
jgi:hypothetical protein